MRGHCSARGQIGTVPVRAALAGPSRALHSTVGWVGIGSDKKGQNKKRIRERDCENCKAGRQTSECKATLVWTRKKERRRLRGEKDDGDGDARQKEKRNAKEKVDGFGERRHEKGWS